MASSQKYLLKSNFDDTIIEVNEKVINSSMLLKNVTELTEINSTVPFCIDCSGPFLRKFIDIIQIYEEYGNDEEKYNIQVIDLFQHFTDDTLADFIKEICIMDSDILLNALADIILAKIKDMSYEEIIQYLEIEDDFTVTEREWQKNNMLEYLISLNDPNFPLQFPLASSQSFYSMKIKFFSPLNILVSRICQRSNEITAFRLSLCSKPLKNECDRHPIKVSQIFINFSYWCFEITVECKMKWAIYVKKENEKYFSAICKRRVMAWNNNFYALFCSGSMSEPQVQALQKHSLSLEWMVPHKNINEVKITFQNFKIFVSSFDLTKFPYSNVFFNIHFNEDFNDGMDFDFVYNHLVAKDLSKEVKMHFFNFSQRLSLTVYKKPNASKFYKCFTFRIPDSIEHSLPQKFIDFLKNYMESNGVYEFRVRHPTIPEKIIYTSSIDPRDKYCVISDLLEYL